MTSTVGDIVLDVRGVRAQYGQARALDDVSLTLGQGEFVTLLGPNGAGKTTLLRAVAGLMPVRRGEIRLGARRVDRLGANRIAALGLALVPEGRRIFPEHTVLENLALGGYLLRKQKAVYDETLQGVLHLFPKLHSRGDQRAGTLSGGEAQMLAVGRALMLRPQVLMLDEPSLGLAPLVVEEILHYLDRLNRNEGLTILLVEQAANLALRHADRAYLLSRGQVTLSGPADEVRRHPEVRRVYFGSEPEPVPQPL